MRDKSRRRLYLSLICQGALNQTVAVFSDQVGISRYLSSALPVTKILPGVVWFGEVPHHLEEIDKLVQKADLAIVVGTSSTVRSADEEHQTVYHLMILPTRCTLLPATHPRWRNTEAQLPYSTSTGAKAIARQIICSLAHAPKPYLRFSLAINLGLVTFRRRAFTTCLLVRTYRINTGRTTGSMTSFLTRLQGLPKLNRLAMVGFAQDTGGSLCQVSHVHLASWCMWRSYSPGLSSWIRNHRNCWLS